MKIGIIGLPNAGKSTVFNALAQARVEVKKHPFTTIEPNVGMVRVPDPRLTRLAELFQPERLIPASIKFVDVAGLVEGASHGEGLGNQFLAALRETTALAHVVRCFKDGSIAHLLGGLDPVRDIEVIRLELLLADLATVEKRLEKIDRGRRADPHKDEDAREVLEVLKDILERGEDCRGTELAGRVRLLLPDLPLLSLKPILYVANTGETGAGEEAVGVAALREKAREDGTKLIEFCGKLEAEIVSLPEEDRGQFREAMEMGEAGLAKLTAAAKNALRLITFFTKEGVEVRAWIIPEGTSARRAAGSIHSDMEKGFIKAEVVSFPVLDTAGSMVEVRQKGQLRIEGRDYPVQEGDVIRFLFKT
ncbi:MAG: redox-regulated ATPase YchF [Candidatus Euphemobacter frigidus]|nr:redox-regulated ATPase YchF [Candidatus Euphemobacter frigidus]MDP8274984.1 redox-regulated ATPase YchF [Candidatus Euphemobacter frigidus]